MSHRVSVPVVAAAAIGLPAAIASAGFVGGSYTFEFMQIASGFIDLENPSSSTFTDFTSIDNPPVGSFLDLQGVIPGTRSFLGSLDFTSASDTAARFDSEFQAATAPFSSTGFEFFFSGGRIDLTSSVAFSVTLDALIGGSGGGVSFLYVYGGGAPHLFFPSSEPVSYTIDFGAGSHTIAWGSLVDPTGGSAVLQDSLIFNFVPAPGAVALLAMAGLAAPRRRR